MSLNTTYKTDFLNVQYIGAYREPALHLGSSHRAAATTRFPAEDNIAIERGGFAQPGDPLAARNI